jgi:hypothetical protein
MRADHFAILNIALAIEALVFVTGAAIVLAVPAWQAHAPLLLPLMVMGALVATPFAVWALSRGARAPKLPLL